MGNQDIFPLKTDLFVRGVAYNKRIDHTCGSTANATNETVRMFISCPSESHSDGNHIVTGMKRKTVISEDRLVT